MRERISRSVRAAGRTLIGVFYVSACVAGIGYFCNAGINGDYGIRKKAEVRSEVVRLETELADLREERARLENLTRRLSTEYLDLDLLDERARAVLQLARSDEIVIDADPALPARH